MALFSEDYLYRTQRGEAIVADSLKFMKGMPDDSVDLVITSPPFALQRQKEYGNVPQDEYVDWLLLFTKEVKRIIKENGSFVIDVGGAYRKNRPVRSLHSFRFLIRMVDEQGWNLAEEFFWYNPAKLPSPIEWVNKRKIRVKDAVNTVWWMSKTDSPKTNLKSVLVPYSDRMKKLFENSEKFYTPKKRPSGHDISSGFSNHNGGAIPSNLLEISNTNSNSQYLRFCKIAGAKGHPARFPERLPEFFVKFLTDEGDLVLDIFAGSNTTGAVAEKLRRNWIALDQDNEYLATSVFRFLQSGDRDTVMRTYTDLKMDASAKMEILKINEELFA